MIDEQGAFLLPLPLAVLSANTKMNSSIQCKSWGNMLTTFDNKM